MAGVLDLDMAGLKEGGDEALAELARYVTVTAARFSRRYPQTEVGDVVQDVLVEVLRNRERLADLGSSERVALYCRRLVRNAVAHQAHRTRQEVGMPDPEAESFRPGSPEHEDPGADAVMRLYLEEAIGGLPDRERAILELLYFEGRTASEVAEALGLGAGTVLTLRNSALRKIRDDLATRQAGGG